MSKERIGLCFGCFIPLHKGHLSMIERAKNENDRIVIGVCGYEGDRGQEYLPFEGRWKLMLRRYHDDKNVIITIVDDHEIGLTGTFSVDAWSIWGKEFFRNAWLDPNDESKEYTWYTGEASYIEKLQQVYPNHNFVLLDRSEIQVSGTMIRENTDQYCDMIAPDFLEAHENWCLRKQYHI